MSTSHEHKEQDADRPVSLQPESLAQQLDTIFRDHPLPSAPDGWDGRLPETLPAIGGCVCIYRGGWLIPLADLADEPLPRCKVAPIIIAAQAVLVLQEQLIEALLEVSRARARRSEEELKQGYLEGIVGMEQLVEVQLEKLLSSQPQAMTPADLEEQGAHQLHDAYPEAENNVCIYRGGQLYPLLFVGELPLPTNHVEKLALAAQAVLGTQERLIAALLCATDTEKTTERQDDNDGGFACYA